MRPALLTMAFAFSASPALSQARPGDSVSVRILNTEIRAAAQIIQQYLDRPLIFTGPGGAMVSLETPRPIPRSDVPRLLRGLLDANGYELLDDSATATLRVRPREIARPIPSQPSFVPAGLSDPATTRPSLELFVVALRHARATEVAATINALFGRGTVTGASGSSPGLAGRGATLSGELTLVADSHANSILIRASRGDFELIRSAVEQIDVRPAQVLIEVLIVEARRDRSFRLGIDAGIADQRIQNTANTTVGGSFTPGTGGLADFTLKVMGVGPWDFDATIRAAAGRGDVNIVSRPTVLAANDEQAEVTVGSQRPFVQVSRSLPTDVVARDQVIQYRDVGTKLVVRPTISIDGTVALSVTQEVSSATSETAFNAPVISTRSVKTDLLVRDGQTIVLGGLSDRQRDAQSSGVPLLSRIPLIGGLFGSQARSTNESELFIFLTPRVIRTDEDARRLTDEVRERAKRIQP